MTTNHRVRVAVVALALAGAAGALPVERPGINQLEHCEAAPQMLDPLESQGS